MKVLINNLDHEGRGITRIENKVTFVPFVLPNEIVDIEISKIKKNYNEAICKKIIEKSENRITPICPYYGTCGGCNTMHMNYESELSWKKEKIINIFKKYLNIEINPEIVSSKNDFNYRNKITLHGNGKILGYMKAETNEIFEIDECPLADKNINEYIKTISEKEDIIIRTNKEGKIISTLNNQKLIETINNYKFQIDINSFFQVNSYICSQIFLELEKNINNTKTVLDLYSGVGTLSIVASNKANKVYSIEVNAHSHKNALINKELNNINNITFMLGKVEEEIKKINDKIDLIITDPPRTGMDKITIKTINKMKPSKIIYISCNPLTLVRDIKELNNYELDHIKIFDMFPKTKHVECFCVLKRK